MLTGFSQFTPADGIPAHDSTQVLIWYSPTALYVGVRAFEAHGAVHATLADRDKITSDDNVQLLIGTFNDRRQAYLFAVNPLGVQMDGTIVEAGVRGVRRIRADVLGAHAAGSQPGLRVPVEGPADRVRLRSRDANSVQEPQVPIDRRAGVGLQRRAPGAALGLRGQLGAGEAVGVIVPRAVRHDRRSARV